MAATSNLKRRLMAVAAYVVPSFPLGYLWHLTIFAKYYQGLEVYREDIAVPLGVLSMVIQGIVWAVIYERMFAGETIAKGALKFAAIACPLAWSFMVLAAAAKHRMSSVSGYVFIETAFLLVHYSVVSPLIAAVHAHPTAKA